MKQGYKRQVQTAKKESPTNQKLIKNFVDDFEKAFQNQLSQGNQLYLLDILEDLKFLNHDQIDKYYQRIEQMLQKFGINLIIDIESAQQL